MGTELVLVTQTEQVRILCALKLVSSLSFESDLRILALHRTDMSHIPALDIE